MKLYFKIFFDQDSKIIEELIKLFEISTKLINWFVELLQNELN